MNQHDINLIRELAKRYMEIACSEKQRRANQRMKDTNDLKIVRPPVIMDEIPWYQMNIDNELTCLCEDKRARDLEYSLRIGLFRAKHFRCDAILDPFLRIGKAFDSTGIGMDAQEDIIRTDDKNHIVSHQYTDVLEEENAVELLRVPQFTLRPDKDEEAVNFYTDLLGDAMPVYLSGIGCTYTAPWDIIARLRGVTPIFYDFYDRPEHLHNIRRKFNEAIIAEIDFLEANGMFEPSCTNLHCTPGAVSGLAQSGTKAAWYRGMAQNLSDISPEMFEEFEIAYAKPIAERFAYTYYGCCEPLHDRMRVVKKISNLRKIGVSPWANEESSGEQIGGNFVYARKPNPAYVAMTTDPASVRAETEKTVKICQKYGCPLEFVLKDISTVGHKPENLIVWANTVADVLDEFYGV